jgi:hypothetical protein
MPRVEAAEGQDNDGCKARSVRDLARILSKRLAAAGIRHTYEEFDDDHSDVDYRMDTSLPFLYRALKP